MNTFQINTICENLLNKIKPYYRGTFSLENLLYESAEYMVANEKNIFIFNSNTHWQKRDGHWLVLFVNRNSIVYFDSFGFAAEKYSEKLSDFIFALTSNIGAQLESTPFPVQHTESRICGLYCIFVSSFLAENWKLTDIIQTHFAAHSSKENDAKVIQWFLNQSFGYLLTDFCKENKLCLNKSELLQQNGKSRIN